MDSEPKIFLGSENEWVKALSESCFDLAGRNRCKKEDIENMMMNAI